MLTPPERRYEEPYADNARWEGFQFRDDDIIIAAPSKSGTTWTQLLVALLIFDGCGFPQPLAQLSPWMDQKVRPVEEVHELLGNQNHRRFIKTHTPLDGVPFSTQLTYVCVGRDPRDAAVSMIHHSANLDWDRFAELIAGAGESPPEPQPKDFVEEQYFEDFIDRDEAWPNWSIRFLAHHYRTFWERRDRSSVGLFHFTDYLSDLPAELLRLAQLLGIGLSRERAVGLAEEAALDRARSRAADIAPEAHLGLFEDTAAFFRAGGHGEWRTRMTDAQQVRYQRRAESLMSTDLLAWVHGGHSGGIAL